MNRLSQQLPVVVITKLPRWKYFQWFLLGFYQLKKKGRIRLKFRLDPASRLSLRVNNSFLLSVGKKLFPVKDAYNLEGYISIDGRKKTFCIDSADSPYLLDSVLLEQVDVYFKMQCPETIEAKGFALTEQVCIPYCDHRHKDESLKSLTDRGERKPCSNLENHLHKIKPLMVGPRRLARGNASWALEKSYRRYLSSSRITATKKLMCYFGNALGPKPSSRVEKPDFDWESDLLSWFGNRVGHPNEKRAQAAARMEGLGTKYDARIINPAHADSGKKGRREDLVIPLRDFCDHIAHFEYNLNISGYRLSMPNRFIESFMAGTAILTDRLKLKWYLPFDKEVVETVEMGYLPLEKVDFRQFESDMKTLPAVKKEEVLEAFYRKWAPDVVAGYIVETVVGKE